MELDIITQTPEEAEASQSTSMSSPMGGKHQRQLSLSAKWASSKALALEYLKRQREVMNWMEKILDRKFATQDLFEELKSGIVLREVQETLYPETADVRSPISRKYSMRMAPWKERENISVYLKHCKALGMNDMSLFCTDDLFDGTNMVQVLFCVQQLMKISEDRHRIETMDDDPHLTFSNQELEMAMSKIELSGVDASALKDLISGSGSAQASPHKQRESDATSGTIKDEEDEFVDAMEEVEDVLDELENELEAEFQCALEQEEDLPDAADCNQDQDLEDADDVDDKREVEPETSEQEDEELEISDDDEEDLTIDPEVQEVLEGMLDMVEEENEDVERDVENDAELQEEDISSDAEITLQEELEEKPEPPLEDIALQETSSYLETEIVIDVQGVQFESELRTELVDASKSNTTIVDLTGSHAHGESASAASQDSKSKRKSKKKTKAKKSVDDDSFDQLDAEAMSKCTCGGKCSIM